MVTFPRGVFWPYRPASGSAEPTYRGMWARIGWAIAPRPRRVWITTAVVLGIMALGLTGLKASGLTNAQEFRGHPDSVTGQTVLAAHFPAGTGSPVIVIGNASAAGPLRPAVTATPEIAAVTPPVTRAGYAYLQGTLTARPDSQAAFATIDRVRSAVAAIPAPAPWSAAPRRPTWTCSARTRMTVIMTVATEETRARCGRWCMTTACR